MERKKMPETTDFKAYKHIFNPNQMNQVPLPSQHPAAGLASSSALPRRVYIRRNNTAAISKCIDLFARLYISALDPFYGPVNINAMSRLESIPRDKDAQKNTNIGIKVNPGSCLYRTNDKSKGLRYFSTKVCEKVKEKGRTNYNQVADELVAEYFDSLGTAAQSPDKREYDMKNIRRRIYDAINVLTALNIIQKEKKEIRWVGLPTNSDQECKKYAEEKIRRQESIRKKTEQLQELVVHLVAYKSLVQRNRQNEKVNGRPADSKILFLPFIILNTNPETVVNCSIAQDKTEYLFRFNQTFQIWDDIEVLKRLGLSHGLEKSVTAAAATEEDREYIKNCLPPALQSYADEILDGNITANLPPPQPSSTNYKLPTILYNHNSTAVSTPRNPNFPYQRIIRRPFRSSAPHGPYTIPPSSASIYRNFGQQQNYALSSSFSGHSLQDFANRLQTSYSPRVFAGLNDHSPQEDVLDCEEKEYPL